MDEFQVQMENNSEIEGVQANGPPYSVEEISEDKHLCSNVVISIEDMLKLLPPINGECSIYRVPKELREMNPKAYTPQVISIGPFHHGCHKDFRATEQYKLRALINFLRRINNGKMKYSLEEDVVKSISLEDLLKTGSLKVLVEKADCWVKEARNCYAEPINMNDHNFLIMMLLDACFIVEVFIQKYHDCYPNDRGFDQIQENVDFSLVYPETAQDIIYDLIKLENQVPFFLLQHIFHLIPEDSRPTCFIHFTYIVLRPGLISRSKICFLTCCTQPKHLVDFLSFYFVPLIPDTQNKQHEKNSGNNNYFLGIFHALCPAHWQKQHEGLNNTEKKKNYNFLSFFRVFLCCLWQKPDKGNSEEDLCPPSITELCEAGVTIKKAKNTDDLMNISFKNGVLMIPPLRIYDNFELMLRNVVAFDQLPAGNDKKYVTQYVLFLDDLISTEKDVHSLVEAGVLINNIGGSDKEVSELFNNLGKFITEYSGSSHFEHISKALREHCNGRWNKAKASLKHNYFNTPWAFISFFAATFLILLTLLQTVFSAISAFPRQPT